MSKYVGIDALLGLTITAIDIDADKENVRIHTKEGRDFHMYHEQDCCESVSLEDIAGELNDLIGSPIVLAEEVTNDSDERDNSFTWTFYKLGTIFGVVALRWYGSSNGYYSESVSIYETTPRRKVE